MKNTLFLLVLTWAFATSLNATILQVPSQYSTIQSAIDAAVNGDTVEVEPGPYFENINFRGKNILVTSQYYHTQDTVYIFTTIIDGSNPINADSASCVIFASGEDSSAILQGFTITGGSGTKWTDIHGAGTYREGGGILVELSSPTIRDNMIINNLAMDNTGVTSAGGGGIRIGDGNPTVCNNVIMNNMGMYGPGIVLNYTGATIRNNVIAQNEGANSFYGGSGIWIYNNHGTDPKIIENNTIVNNTCMQAAGTGGILCQAATNVRMKNNIIYGNVCASGLQIKVLGTAPSVTYSDIQGGFTGIGNIDLDPQFGGQSYFLSPGSQCIDAGDTAVAYNDIEDSLQLGQALYPSMGGLRNDMGAYGGPCVRLLPVFQTVLGMQQNQNYAALTLFPNPNAGRFSLQSNAAWDAAEISILNMLGEEVHREQLGTLSSNVNKEISLDLPKGIYLLRLRDALHVESTRFLIR